MVSIIPESEFDKIKGQAFKPHNNEGVIYFKVVALKPETIANDPETTVMESPGVIVAGKLEDIKAQMNEWFDQLASDYTS